jgi:hypothetical protein
VAGEEESGDEDWQQYNGPASIIVVYWINVFDMLTWCLLSTCDYFILIIIYSIVLLGYKCTCVRVVLLRCLDR